MTPIALAALALLGVRDRALTLSQVRRVVEPVLDYVDARGLPHTGIGAAAHQRRRRARRCCRCAGRRWSAPTPRAPSRCSRSSPATTSSPRSTGTRAIHHFVNRAIVELSILEVGDLTGREALARGFQAALDLRDLLKYEFFFPDKETFRDELIRELALIDPDWQPTDGDVARTRKLLRAEPVPVRAPGAAVLRRRAVGGGRAPRRARPATRPVDEDALLDRCAAVGQQLLLQGKLHGPESLSRELFASAVRLAAQPGPGRGPEHAPEASRTSRPGGGRSPRRSAG